MRGACFQEVGVVACLELPEPSLRAATDAIVKVNLAGLCGSDLHVFHGREAGMDPGTVMGHELVGSVVEVGAEVRDIAVGDRIYTPFTTSCGRCYFCRRGMTCRCTAGQLFGWVEGGRGLPGCQSEYVRVPLADGTLKPIPDAVSDAAALLLGDNFSTGYYCAEMAEVGPEGTYVVVGCGTVGLLSIIAAKHLGADTLFAIDPVPERRAEAEALGATALAPGEAALKQIRETTDGRGADAVMEVVGIPDAQKLAYDALRPGGILSVVGCHSTPHFAFSPVDAFDKNLTYRTGRCPARHYMDRLTDLVADGTFQLDRFVSRRFAVEECVEAYDVFANRRDGCLKAALRFD